ncbi:SDR family NAD(P)-dependent oxidoreductase [Janthinobacterium agaricidamnosum]|uniref:Short chain dehydrogenase family protein n=1 Tax=Janthinobacterium agaricidamnosum NBRC 102515 = DSM 9628 TaxID=1349767 RepID=W0V2T9_9BURK|nr:SDR family oxidoreductase [Janthinobacterium agaricidamnosum]CDG81668.1 short chain dehydrogenase family protein [Janthinobacterium agaricidamnosum NBRC 102515 = DSM 9628]
MNQQATVNAAGAVIISGGSRGLGLALVRDALAQGRIVATCSRHDTPALRELREADPEEMRFMWRALDVTDAAASKQFVRAVVQRYGTIAGLVNNAGQSDGQFLSLTSEELVQRLLAVNLEAVIRMTRLVAPYMLRENGGSIVSLGSISGTRGFAGLSVYGATKSALDGFSRCLARELGTRQVRVNVVAPGLLTTDMADATTEAEKRQIVALTPMGRLGSVDDVVGIVRFLLSPDAAFISGQSIVVDGGFTC